MCRMYFGIADRVARNAAIATESFVESQRESQITVTIEVPRRGARMCSTVRAMVKARRERLLSMDRAKRGRHTV